MNKHIFLIILFVTSLKCYGGVAESADSAYLAGNYNEALAIYKSIEEEEGISAQLLYNMGNTYYMMSDFGNAMLCYERAYKLDPSLKPVKNNLQFLRSKIDDANRAEQKGKKLNVEEDEMTFFQSVHNAIGKEVASDRWATWAAVGFILFLFCLGIYVFSKRVVLRKTGFFGGGIILGLTVICVIFACVAYSAFKDKEEGVIVAYKINLQVEPTANEKNENDNAGVLTRGTKVRIIAEETDAEGNVLWYKVRLNSNYLGWVKKSDLEII